jgi:hypothetical protein
MIRNASRWTLLALCLAALAGCVSAPKRQAYNVEANASIKEIEVLQTRHSEVETLIVNNPGASFGLIGAAIAEANRASKTNKLQAHLEAAEFDHNAVLAETLKSALEAEGYTVTMPSPTAEGDDAKTKRDLWGLRKDRPTGTGRADALLDVSFGFIGYASAGAGDSAPYRPTVMLSARLIDATSGDVLFAEQVLYNNVFNNQAAIVVEPDTRFTYPDFDDLDAAGPVSAEGMRVAIEAAVLRMAKAL